MPPKIPRVFRLAQCLAFILIPSIHAADPASNSPPPPSSAAPITGVQPGTWQVEIEASLPDALETSGARFQIFVDGELVKFDKKRAHGDSGDTYNPTWLIDPLEEPGQYRLRHLRPLVITKPNSTVTVRPWDDGTVTSVELRPRVDGVSYSGQPGGTNGVYFPAENAEFKITRLGDFDPGSRTKGRIVVQRLRLADGDPPAWSVVGERVTHVGTVLEQSLDGSDKTVSVDIPTDDFGCFGVSVEFEETSDGELHRTTQFLGTVAVVPERDLSATNEAGKFMVSTGRWQERNGFPLAEAVKRMGFDWYRTEYPWERFEPNANNEFDWSEPDAMHAQCKKYGIFTMNLAAHAPSWAQPSSTDGLKLIPHWKENYYFDGTPSPEHLDDWRDAWADYLSRYSGTVKALNIWNEPWEGGGISNWRSSAAYYRTLFQKAKEARDSVDPTVKLVAADSADNTAWKLLASDIADDLDVMSVHYETPGTTTAWALGDHHGFEVWDTETWLAHLGDASIARMAVHQFLQGAGKVSLWSESMLLYTNKKIPTPSVPGIAALVHLLDDTNDVTLVHPDRPPYVVLFRGNEGNPHVAMVSTTLSEYIARIPGTPWSQQSNDDCVMQLELPSDYRDNVELLDVFANPLPANINSNRLRIPVDRDVRYLRFDGPYEVFEKALTDAHVDGLTPVEIAVEDIRILPGSDKAHFQVRLRNVHPFELEGELAVETSWPSETPLKIFTLKPGEEQSLTCTLDVSGMDLTSEAACEVKIDVATDRGTAAWKERLHVAMIGRGTPIVDADLRDWDEVNAVPVTLRSSDQKASPSDLYDPQKPWEKPSADPDGLTATAAFCRDDDFLYVMARVEEKGPKEVLPSMLTSEELHEFQNPPMDHIYVVPGPRPPWVAPKLQLAIGPVDRTEKIDGHEAFAPGDPMYRYSSNIAALHQLLLYPTQGGGAEVLRMRQKDFFFLHPLPVDYGWMKEHCQVEGAKVSVKVDEDGYTYEAAIPWDELNTVSNESGDEIYLSFLVQGQDRKKVEWSFCRSQAGLSPSDWGNMNGKYVWGARTKWWFD